MAPTDQLGVVTFNEATVRQLKASKPDVVITDNENADPRIGWLEAPPDPKTGQWTLHELKKGDDSTRGAFHSLAGT